MVPVLECTFGSTGKLLGMEGNRNPLMTGSKKVRRIALLTPNYSELTTKKLMLAEV